MNILRLFSRKSPEHASSWVDRAKDGESMEGFGTWARTSPQQVAAFLKLSYLSSLARESETLKALDPEVLLADAHAFRMQQRRRYVGTAAVAAIVVVGVLVAIVRYDRTDNGVAWITYSASATVRTVKLPDGSTVRLQRGSTLRTRFTAERRDVELPLGKGLFTVTPAGKDRPFHVGTQTAAVVVLGTQFDVESTESYTAVAVMGGVVSVRSTHPGSEPRTLEAGGKVVVLADGSFSEDARSPDAQGSAEPKAPERVVAPGSTLAQVAAAFNVVNARPQLFVEPEAQNEPLWATTIDVTNARELIQTLKAQSDLTVIGDVESERVIVRKNKK